MWFCLQLVESWFRIHDCHNMVWSCSMSSSTKLTWRWQPFLCRKTSVRSPPPSQLGPGYGWLACRVSNCRVSIASIIFIYIYNIYIYNLFRFEVTASWFIIIILLQSQWTFKLWLLWNIKHSGWNWNTTYIHPKCFTVHSNVIFFIAIVAIW